MNRTTILLVKKPYQPPLLTKYGCLTEMTKASHLTGSMGDGGTGKKT
jgi:hypothetical protein